MFGAALPYKDRPHKKKKISPTNLFLKNQTLFSSRTGYEVTRKAGFIVSKHVKPTEVALKHWKLSFNVSLPQLPAPVA